MKPYYLFFFCFLLLSGCSSVGYYFDAVNGHLNILADQEAINDILQQENTSSELKSKLVLATQARDFASSEMLLPDNDSYRYYVDINRPYVVWNVIATEKYSIKAHQWCFLVVGCVSYRGYYNQEDAKAFAKNLIAQGYDVNISGAQAYSTLGWFDDPLLSTMIQHNEARIVGLIIHELAHQQVYIKNDSAFNEAFATSVEIEGIKRWFTQRSDSSAKSQIKLYENYLQVRQREIEFKHLLKTTQLKLEHLFESEKFVTANNKEKLKKQIYQQLKIDYQQLKKSWQDYNGYDNWMNRPLNNAHLALIATYHDKVPAFQTILKLSNNDIKIFYQKVKLISEMTKDNRNNRLATFH
jgi:predicted aminopeptidase